MKNEFQYRLQRSLADSGLTAAELSKKSGISEANISNYINGKYVPKQDKCYLLAVALGVDPGWLMIGDEPVSDRQQARNRFDEALINAYHLADEGTQAAVCKLLDVKR